MPNNKPIVLTFVAYYLPGYKSGGPVRTIANMVEQLSDDLDFHIVTADRDFRDPQPYPNVSIGKWNAVGRAKVFYTSPSNQKLRSLARLIKETPHDVLYLNSFFQPVFTLRPLLTRRFGLIPSRPTVIAPRGEFSKGALALKRGKKALFMFAARALEIHGGMTWQASSEHEAEDIRNAMGATATRLHIAPNLAPSLRSVEAGVQERTRSPEEPFRVCFISRISPMKNLEFALRVLGRVQKPLIFDIYGPIEDVSYWNKCEALIKAMAAPVMVKYKGSIEHDQVGKTFRRYDLFFFPTLGENFGHVILESMLAGTPVLLADTTPWRGLEGLGVGWDLPLAGPGAFVAAIQEAASMESSQYSFWRDRVREFARQKCDAAGVLAANKELFLKIIEPRRISAGESPNH